MKKFMILLIALIPLLLIGTIEFASVIIKEAYYITAEQIVFPVEYGVLTHFNKEQPTSISSHKFQPSSSS